LPVERDVVVILVFDRAIAALLTSANTVALPTERLELTDTVLSTVNAPPTPRVVPTLAEVPTSIPALTIKFFSIDI
jgi:hypothetical protein